MADAPAPPDPVDDAPPPKKPGKLLLLPLLALVLGCGGGYAYYAQAASPDAEPPAPEFEAFASLPGIIVNPAGTSGRRYLMVDLSFEVVDDKAVQEVSEQEIVLRDAVVRTLGEHTVGQLASVSGREALKDTLHARMGAVLEGEIGQLYFTQYVLQ